MTASSIHRLASPALPTALRCGPMSSHVKAHRLPGFRRQSVAPGRHQVDDFSNPGIRNGSSLGPEQVRRPGSAFPRAAGRFSRANSLGLLLIAVLAVARPDVALAGSPFATGANATQQQLVAILTPLAAVAVMVSGAMAWFGRLSWWWMVAVVIGTVLVFGGPQIVSWIRGLFGV